MTVLSKLSKAASWAFNNNGNVADPTRLRLIDGTPIHSTGLRRAFHNRRTVATVLTTASFVGLTYFVAPENTKRNLAIAAIGMAIGGALNKGHNNMRFKRRFPNYKDLCFNTYAHQGVTSPDDLKNAISLRRSYTTSLPLDSLVSAAFITLTDPIRGPSMITVPWFVADAADDATQALRFQNVVNGKWIIEATPPPKRQPARESLIDGIAAAIPTRYPVPVPIPA